MGSKLKITTGFRRDAFQTVGIQAKMTPQHIAREARRPSSSSVKITTELKAGWMVTVRVVTWVAFDGAEAVQTGRVTGRRDAARDHAPAAGSAHHRLSPLQRGEEKH